MFQKLKTTINKNALLGVWLFVFPAMVMADQQAEYKKNISAIGKEIKRISKNLNANKALLKDQQDELLAVEQKISEVSRNMSLLEQQISERQQQNEGIEKKIQTLSEQQHKDQQALAGLVLNRYINGQPNYVKMLLNQQNPYAVGRLNNYYDYFAQARQQKIAVLRTQLQSIQKLKQEQEQVLIALEQTKEQQVIQQQQLDTSKKKRKQSVENLNKKVAQGSEKLAKLQRDRERLNKLLKQIAVQAKKMRELEQERLRQQQEQGKKPDKTAPIIRPLVKGGFIKQRGRLRYPVKGKQKYKYGSRLAESGMLAEGMFFDTNGGTSVKSIFRGRVMFADFLKGYGLLLIIDHGDDHISLYGHNEVLYKKVGDMVETDELVAKSGITGGLKSAGLYFEIRNKATPVDPAKWCQ